MTTAYKTQFGSLADYEKGRVEPIEDDIKHYAFSNCFEIANAAQAYEKIAFGQNQNYVMEVIRAEGNSPWYTCAHDEFALCMDGEVEIHLIQLESSQIVADENKEGAIIVEGELVAGEPQGVKMGWMKLNRGHQGMLPKNCAYQFRSNSPSVLIQQTCKGDLTIERWSEVCQTE